MSLKNTLECTQLKRKRARVNAEIDDRRRGMRFGALLFGSLIACAFVSVYLTTNPIVPGLFLGTAAIGGVAAFIKGRNGQ